MLNGNQCPLCGALHQEDDKRRKQDEKSEKITFYCAKLRSQLSDFVCAKLTAGQASEAERILKSIESIIRMAEMGVF